MSTPPVKKACDACHRRKVRCSGGQPCNNCGQATLHCTYLAVPQKKGPKGSRAKVISEIRGTQQQSSPPRPTSNHATNPFVFDFNSPPTSPPSARRPALLSQDTMEICVDFFFVKMCTTAWILDRQTLSDLITSRFADDAEVYCLAASLCAFVMVQPGMNLAVAPGSHYEGEPPENRYGYANMLLDDIIRVRKSVDYIGSPTLSSVQISFFLFSCYFTLEKQNMCWFHLREAATLAQIMGMHEEASYLTLDPIESIYRRRTYWLLLVTERAYALERHRPLSLHATIELPDARGTAEEESISGFLHLISLFRCIDDEFMALWNKAKSQCTASWFSQLQQRLSNALPSTPETTESQIADIKVTLHWLRIMVWQLSITNGCLSSSSLDLSLTFKFPIQVARDLIQDVANISLDAMEVHGIGLIEKLFDVACTLTDVISCVPLEPAATTPEDETPLAYLNQLLNLISQLRSGASRYLPLLLTKVFENLPNMAPPIGPMPLSIKQGYAGASDNVPTPIPPKGLQIPLSAGLGSFGRPMTGVVTVQHLQAQQRPAYNDQALNLPAYSSSSQESETTMTPSPMGTPPMPSGPPGNVVVQLHSQLPLPPVPRSVPTVVGAAVHLHDYPG
ncbi:hypothetical protein A1O1_01931 [Capronia coronata CBS 617.96]|uniref:Zn(2)-C6 fungal-type domain-containing protein n=1 Tax=Capronia coronata CBS 617.96 TaxID=1182541 RepID=W9ZGB4_9EURO|nr:uncharacterized protein A1O1_01931 [Capronia coronata CBS 617.96]EXJ93539.1 hypothetical protein A1O1_01931 [Capronia coronata CBS 617.96]